MGGGTGYTGSSNVKKYDYPNGGLNRYLVFTSLIAGCGGLIFGYDLGISGGVTSMDPFLKNFFPTVYSKEKGIVNDGGDMYCRFDSHLLTLFTSSLYLAALFASYPASLITRKLGRKASMFGGGFIFLIGAILNASAVNVAMLIIGRILLGIGIGFCNQSIPVYLNEIAPANLRGSLNQLFQMAITVGILGANIVNYFTSRSESGWRISLGGAAVPGLLITVGSLFLRDTPNSILERGNHEKAKEMLRKIRGTEEVEAEFEDIVKASEEAKKAEHPWRNLMQRRYRPQLVFCTLIPFFQQFTGMNVVMFYAPVLFKTLGFGQNASLLTALITGVVNMLATLVSIRYADRLGRRTLFLEGGIQMIICQIVVASLIWMTFGTVGVGAMSKGTAVTMVVFVCGFVAAFAWSWGPLGWLVPSELCPLEIRSAGQAMNSAVNMFFTFIIGQFFLSLLCALKFGLFLFFAAFVLVMTAFIYLFLPETKMVPIEEMTSVLSRHWFWKRYYGDDNEGPGSNASLELV